MFFVLPAICPHNLSLFIYVYIYVYTCMQLYLYIYKYVYVNMYICRSMYGFTDHNCRPSRNVQDHEFQFYLDRQRQSVYAKSYLRFISLGLTRASFGRLPTRPPSHDPVSPPATHSLGARPSVCLLPTLLWALPPDPGNINRGGDT